MTNFDKWSYYMKDIESPEIYIEWGFYHLISAALQRRVWLYSDPSTGKPAGHALFPNEYIILVGKPATGKGRVITQEASIIKHETMQEVGTDGKLKYIIPCSPDKITLESLTQHMAKSLRTKVKKIDDKTIYSYAYSPCCFLIEELEVLFAQNTNDMVSVVVHCYDSHDLHYKTKHQGEDDIKNVCVSMIAGTTPDSIKDLMQNKIIKKGFNSRAVMIFADEPRFYRQFPGINHEQQRAFNELVAYVKQLTEVFNEVVLSPEAKEHHRKIYEGGQLQRERVNKDPRLDDYYGRKNLHWLKLMIALHYSEKCDTNVIGIETVDRALMVLRNAEVRMSEAYQTSGRNLLHESCTHVLRYIEEKITVPYKTLRWEFNKDLVKTELDEVIDVLVSTGRIRNNGGAFSLIIAPSQTNGHIIQQQPTTV